MNDAVTVFFVTFIAMFFVMPIFLGVLRLLGIYSIVNEREYRIYVLFGKVICVLQEPGFYLLIARITWRAPLIAWLEKCYVVDMRLDQQYLRSQAVNSEEGAPVGIGVWYEMFISDPVNFIFKNVDPRGSLAANVSNSTVRCLSNMPLADMLETRHQMSQTVRAEVSEKSHEWGYKLGSVYIRKVHFRDGAMIHQIEEKVTNRLRQVTSSIKQEGANQVSMITSAADRQAATQLGIAAALRPQIVGQALEHILSDAEIASVMFEILENQRMLESDARLILLPEGNLQAQLLAAQDVLIAPRAPQVSPAGAAGSAAGAGGAAGLGNDPNAPKNKRADKPPIV